MAVIRDLVAEVKEAITARRGEPGTFTLRLFSALDAKTSAQVFVDARNPAHPVARMTLRVDNAELPPITAIVGAPWSAARDTRASRTARWRAAAKDS